VLQTAAGGTGRVEGANKRKNPCCRRWMGELGGLKEQIRGKIRVADGGWGNWTGRRVK